MLETTNAEFSFIEVWFTDQNNRSFEIEDNVFKNVQSYDFLSFARKFGDKYGKKLMGIATKAGRDAAKTDFENSSSKNWRSNRRFNWK